MVLCSSIVSPPNITRGKVSQKVEEPVSNHTLDEMLVLEVRSKLGLVKKIPACTRMLIGIGVGDLELGIVEMCIPSLPRPLDVLSLRERLWLKST